MNPAGHVLLLLLVAALLAALRACILKNRPFRAALLAIAAGTAILSYAAGIAGSMP